MSDNNTTNNEMPHIDGITPTDTAHMDVKRMSEQETTVKKALKSDFKKLYVKQFTTDWQTQRLVRETEIDVMSLPAIEALIARRMVEGQIEKLDSLMDYADNYLEWNDVDGFSEKVMTEKIEREKRELNQQLTDLERSNG